MNNGPESLVESGHALLVFRTRFRGGSNGVVALARMEANAAWSADDRALARAVEAQLGVILAQFTQQRRLETLSRTDPLTGLLNRRAFIEEVDRQLARDSREGHSGALFYVDLDNFKPINDRLGHAAGDEALIKVAAALKGNARRYDLVARIGGDEFALWLSHADQATALRRAQALSENIAALVPPNAGDLPSLGASIGVACWTPAQVEPAELLLARADRAMYIAKNEGKQRIFADEPVPAASGSAA
ncbi:MAG: GGDEF domain-containing protein [Alphaproteobacteria bacterium]|nr:GGDEF domain-containing protein [Alphaproteobacteria bacterium]